MPVVTTIKLTGDNHKDVDMVCATIKAISDKSGVALRGPIPLPTKKLVVPAENLPDGEGAETWDHWEMRFHKLSRSSTNSSKDEKALKAIMMIEYPDSVTIELSLRNLG